MRPWLAWSTFVLAAAVARPAAAGSELNGGVVKIELYIPKDNGDGGNAQSNDDTKYQAVSDPSMSPDMKRYLNAARCACDRHDLTGTAASRQQFLLKLSFGTPPNPAPGVIPLAGYAGDDCAATNVDASVLAQRCSKVADLPDANVLVRAQNVFARAGDLLAPGVDASNVANACAPGRSKADIIVVSGTSSRFVESGTAFTVPFDLTPPTMPITVTPIGLENAIRISWTAPATDQPTYYQALCMRADNGLPAHTANDPNTPEPTHAAQFDSTQSLCAVAPTEPMAATLGDGTAPEGSLPDALKILDKRYLCGQSSGSGSSIDLAALTNDVPYWVVVLAIDSAGNYDARYVPRPVTPKAVTDFWEDVNAENPDVNGGFCVAQVGKDGSAASALLVLGAIGVAVRRRRRSRGRARAAGLGLVGLAVITAPGLARAQNYDPYWVDADADATDRTPDPTWHLGLRLGPYHPAIDASFTSSPGPFRRMFGPGYQLVPQLDLHRVWQTSAVQLGVGFSGGYYEKSAEVYMANTNPADPLRPRVSGATNTFKMVPLSVTGLVRLTALDDRWGIPVVPYARGGVAYDVWWVRTPTGDLAMTSCDTCKDKALGASAGLIGAVGIAIRGERLDSEASHSMKNGGVEHAGFYAELETGWVDGFGNAKRLSLGDTTWYAGVDFEF